MAKDISKLTKEERAKAIDDSIERIKEATTNLIENVGGREKEFVDVKKRLITLEYTVGRILELLGRME